MPLMFIAQWHCTRRGLQGGPRRDRCWLAGRLRPCKRESAGARSFTSAKWPNSASPRQSDSAEKSTISKYTARRRLDPGCKRPARRRRACRRTRLAECSSCQQCTNRRSRPHCNSCLQAKHLCLLRSKRPTRHGSAS